MNINTLLYATPELSRMIAELDDEVFRGETIVRSQISAIHTHPDFTQVAEICREIMARAEAVCRN